VNDVFFGLQPIEFVAHDDGQGARAFVAPELVAQFGLKKSLVENLPRKMGGRCADLASLDGVTIRYQKVEVRLKITIAQSALEFADASYMP
ncbi:FimD/PapC N-terminal domain-containing protein, partial [Burkholderia pseudomallei]